MISLRKVDETNFEDVIRLELDASQQSFVAPNVYSVAQSKIYPSLIPLAIETEDKVIGFALYGEDPDTGKIKVVRLMIESSEQEKGYGTEAISLILERIADEYSTETVCIHLVEGNSVAEKVYRKLGFEPTGEVDDDGERIFELRIRSKPKQSSNSTPASAPR